MLAALFVAAPANAQMTAEQRTDLNDLSRAAASIEQCAKQLPRPCSSEWHGINFTMTDGWHFQLFVSERTQWEIACRYDRVESNRICTLTQQANGGNFYVIDSSSGYSLSWGGNAYPGSEMVAKLGSGEPLRFREDKGIYGDNAGLMLRIMWLVPSGIFRWHSWPENLPRDIEVDLAQFREINLFLHAAAIQFATSANRPK